MQITFQHDNIRYKNDDIKCTYQHVFLVPPYPLPPTIWLQSYWAKLPHQPSQQVSCCDVTSHIVKSNSIPHLGKGWGWGKVE